MESLDTKYLLVLISSYGKFECDIQKGKTNILK